MQEKTKEHVKEFLYHRHLRPELEVFYNLLWVKFEKTRYPVPFGSGEFVEQSLDYELDGYALFDSSVMSPTEAFSIIENSELETSSGYFQPKVARETLKSLGNGIYRVEIF